MAARRCQKCNSTKLRWSTIRRHVPIDVLRCTECNTVNASEDWIAPSVALHQGRCYNCGGRYEIDRCSNCELTEAETHQVHDELRALVSNKPGLLEAARLATRQGRKVLALKLATAAYAQNERGRAATARAMRVWLLGAMGYNRIALAEAQTWVEEDKDPPAVAWATYGQQQEAADVPGAASEAYGRALLKDPNQHGLRARRAKLLLKLRREGQAKDESCKVLQSNPDDKSAAMALAVVEQLCDLYETRYRDDEVMHVIEESGEYVQRSAKLLTHRARIAAASGDMASAKTDLQRALKIDPNLEAIHKVRESMTDNTERTSWWRW